MLLVEDAVILRHEEYRIKFSAALFLFTADNTKASLSKSKNIRQLEKTGSTAVSATTFKSTLPTANARQLQGQTQGSNSGSVHSGKAPVQEVGYQLRSGRHTSRNTEALRQTRRTPQRKQDMKTMKETSHKGQIFTERTTAKNVRCAQDQHLESTGKVAVYDVKMTLSEFSNAEVTECRSTMQILPGFSHGSAAPAKDDNPMKDTVVSTASVRKGRSRKSVCQPAAQLPDTGIHESLSPTMALKSNEFGDVEEHVAEDANDGTSATEKNCLRDVAAIESRRSETAKCLDYVQLGKNERTAEEALNTEECPDLKNSGQDMFVAHQCTETSIVSGMTTTIEHGFLTPGQLRRGRSTIHELADGSCRRKTPRNVRNSLILRKFSPEER
jgi:hypothetical protein